VIAASPSATGQHFFWGTSTRFASLAREMSHKESWGLISLLQTHPTTTGALMNFARLELGLRRSRPSLSKTQIAWECCAGWHTKAIYLAR
jgi:hypothetical protein